MATVVEIDPRRSSTILAILVGCGIYKSPDGGETWHRLSVDSGAVRSLAIDPASSSRIFVGTWTSGFSNSKERGLFASTDGGQTWKTFENPLDITGLHIAESASGGASVYALT